MRSRAFMQFPRPTSPSLRRPGEAAGSNANHNSNGPPHRVRFPDNVDGTGAPPPTLLTSSLGVLQLVTDCLTAAVAFVCIASVSTMLGVLHVIVRPFSITAYRRLAAQFVAAPFLDALALLLPNTRICLTGDSDLPTPVGTSLLVSNHLADGDWWTIFMLGRCLGLQGSIKVFLRNEYLNVSIPDEQLGGRSNGNASSSSSSSTSSSSTSSSTTTNALASATAAAVASSSSSSYSGKTPVAGLKPPPPSAHIHTNGGGSTVGGTNAPANGSSASHAPTVAAASAASSSPLHSYPQDLSILAKLLHLFLEFPLINGEDYASNREQLFQLLRSFAEHDGPASAPIHLLFFPEGWSSQHNGGADRAAILKISNDFAQREGRPQLKHLLLPRARGFHSSLECLRESSPVVFDVTMVRANPSTGWPTRFVPTVFVMAHRDTHSTQANIGYDGSLPPSIPLSAPTLWTILRRRFPREIHIRIKRYSMEEVLQDRTWLDKRWAEKDRLLSHFARHQSFPLDGRGYCRHRVLDSRFYSLETSVMSLLRLLLVPFAAPLLLLLSIPLVWSFAWIWLIHRLYRLLYPDPVLRERGTDVAVVEESGQTPGSSSAGTPFCPATPFASPSVTSWRDLFSNTRDSEPPGGGG